MKKLIFIALFVCCATLAGHAQATDLEIANQRLVKAIDALEKADAVIAAQTVQIQEMEKREALRIELEKYKDEMVNLYREDNQRMRRELHKTKWQKFFDRAEKWGVFAAGIAIGSGL